MDNTIKIFFAGDFCSKPSTSLITVSDELKEVIKDCDLKIINFEVPLKPDNVNVKHQKRERFFQNDDVPSFLLDLGFNLFTLANNHLFDWDDEGYQKTKKYLGENSFGAGVYDEAYKIKKVSINGVNIGFYSLTYNAYKGVFSDCDDHSGLGCAYVNDLRVNHDIMDAKKDVDFLFVLVHDGIEYIDIPLPETIARYRDFVDYGADAVIGTHPHCPQGWEIYKDKPIFYSLGNFFFNSKKDTLYRAWNRPHWYEGRCVILTINNGKIAFEVINTRNVDNIIIQIDSSEESKQHNEIICRYLQDKNFYNQYLVQLLESQYTNEYFLLKNLPNKESLFLLKNDLRVKRMIRMLKTK
jgi:poly-gamma-glutamate synthesis protein (capsule biosynthesis protein)